MTYLGNRANVGAIWGLACLALIVAGCGRSPAQEGDLVGVYVPDAATVADARSRGGYNPRATSLTLNGDGTFVLVDMPDWWLAIDGRSHRGYDTVSGRWRLNPSRSGQDGRELLLEVSPGGTYSSANESKRQGYVFFPMRVVGGGSAYALQQWLGDPDEGHLIRFVGAKRGSK